MSASMSLTAQAASRATAAYRRGLNGPLDPAWSREDSRQYRLQAPVCLDPSPI